MAPGRARYRGPWRATCALCRWEGPERVSLDDAEIDQERHVLYSGHQMALRRRDEPLDMIREFAARALRAQEAINELGAGPPGTGSRAKRRVE